MVDAEAQKPGSTRALVALLAFVLGFATVPHRVCERDAARWFAGDPERVDALARGVEEWLGGELPAFHTGSARFDGEWRLVTYMMAAMGFGQVARERPETSAQNLARMERCLDALLDPALRAFDTTAWNEDALSGERGHVGFLGYAALPLALHRTLRPASRFAAREDAILQALATRIERSSDGFLETYPGETYPVDNAPALGALALHARALGTAPSPALARGLAAMRSPGRDRHTGLLFQTAGAPRASGTALASYFLSFADPALSAELYRVLERRHFRTVLGFGGVLEYPPGSEGPGDVDSGPVVLGFGISASGFALGASRVHADIDTFRAISASAHLFGAPHEERGVRHYRTGGPIGDAILFAMLTAPRP